MASCDHHYSCTCASLGAATDKTDHAKIGPPGVCEGDADIERLHSLEEEDLAWTRAARLLLQCSFYMSFLPIIEPRRNRTNKEAAALARKATTMADSIVYINRNLHYHLQAPLLREKQQALTDGSWWSDKSLGEDATARPEACALLWQALFQAVVPPGSMYFKSPAGKEDGIAAALVFMALDTVSPTCTLLCIYYTLCCAVTTVGACNAYTVKERVICTDCVCVTVCALLFHLLRVDLHLHLYYK